MKYILKNNVFKEGKNYFAGQEVSEKEAKSIGLHNCEITGKKAPVKKIKKGKKK